MKRPTIFLSSTIYDFRDLRSALKDYLELRGCTVYASDYNDFAKDLDKHSYEACLNAIEGADIFILFIGARVGGLVDKDKRISITRAEYERAYELAQQGQIRIVSFVRTDVWTYRESLNDLERFLRQQDQMQGEQPDLRAAPTKFMSDARSIIEFIEMVSRNAETKAAIEGAGVFPVANWLHQFSTFGEIRAVIDPLILAGFEVSQASGRKALELRLTALLQQVLYKVKGNAVAPVAAIRNLVGELGLSVEDVVSQVEVPKDAWSRLIMLASFVLAVRVSSAPLLPYLNDHLLMGYDRKDSTFTETDEHRVLNTLITAMDRYEQARGQFDFQALVKNVQVSRPPIKVPGEQLVTALHLLIRWAEIIQLAVALTAAMRGKQMVVPKPMPKGPLVDQEDALHREELTIEQVIALVDNYRP